VCGRHPVAHLHSNPRTRQCCNGKLSVSGVQLSQVWGSERDARCAADSEIRCRELMFLMSPARTEFASVESSLASLSELRRDREHRGQGLPSRSVPAPLHRKQSRETIDTIHYPPREARSVRPRTSDRWCVQLLRKEIGFVTGFVTVLRCASPKAPHVSITVTSGFTGAPLLPCRECQRRLAQRSPA
jgi:hypothetical protein